MWHTMVRGTFDMALSEHAGQKRRWFDKWIGECILRSLKDSISMKRTSEREDEDEDCAEDDGKELLASSSSLQKASVSVDRNDRQLSSEVSGKSFRSLLLRALWTSEGAR